MTGVCKATELVHVCQIRLGNCHIWQFAKVFRRTRMNRLNSRRRNGRVCASVWFCCADLIYGV